MNVYAKAPDATVLADGRSVQTQREIDCAVFSDALAYPRSQKRVEKRRDIVAREGGAFAAHEPAAGAEDRHGTSDEVQIAGASARSVDQKRLQRIAARHVRRRPRRL